MILVEQTISFCKGMLPKEASDAQEERKDVQHNVPEGTTILAKKDVRRGEYFCAPKAKAKSGAKQGAAKQKGSKAIKHNVQTFQLFEKLKVDAPITTDDIPDCLEKLDALLVEYQVKTKEFEAKREELRRQIMEGATIEEVLGTDDKVEDEAGVDAGEEGGEAATGDAAADDA
eukprot:NODE_24461_length_624_cov_2.863179.p2 GENE.NODE_24461_length_624_cov_2.863179~~NODE_24461_length_624_cov_2.863179.p2  ORF type:complete len:173 (-),score=69.18 NODE_24461_length_624_cov_2.863179:106-624(-)